MLPMWAQPTYLGALWDVAKAFTAALLSERRRPRTSNGRGHDGAGGRHRPGNGDAARLFRPWPVVVVAATYLLMRVCQSGEVEKFQVTKIDDKPA